MTQINVEIKSFTFARGPHVSQTILSNLLKCSIHYADLMLDLLLIFEYYSNGSRANSYMTALLVFLPNVCIFLFYSLFKLVCQNTKEPAGYLTKQSLILCTFSLFNVYIFLGHIVWLYYYYQKLTESTKITELSKPSSFKRDLTEIKYVLLMASLFHVLFNSLPNIFIQSIYISSQASASMFATMNTIRLLAILKIALSFVRICSTSASFIKHFIVNEFAMNDFKFQEWKFMLCRTMANICLLAARTIPIIVLANYSMPSCIAFIVFSYLRQFIHELVVFCSTCDRQLSCLTIFWCFVLSSLKTSVLFGDTDVLDLLKKRIKNGLVLVNCFFICIETGALFGLIFMFGMTHFWQLALVTGLFYVNAFGVDLFYWNTVYGKAPGIRKKFQNWIYAENLKIQSNQQIENETEGFLIISTP